MPTKADMHSTTSGKRLALLCVFGILLLLAASATDPTTQSNTTPTARNTSHVVSYTEHPTIEIGTDAAFESQGWPGSGTKEDPYLIEGLNITTDEFVPLINITDTTAYFEIRNCYINGDRGWVGDAPYGIMFDNVTHGTIDGCFIVYCGEGVYIFESSNCILSNNTSRWGEYGFHFRVGANHTVINNTAFEIWEHGFFAEHDWVNNTVANNTVYDTDDYGFEFGADSANNTVTNNTATNTEGGFYFLSGYNDTITGNMVNGSSRESYWAFQCSHSTNCTVANNTVDNSNGHGINFSWTSNSTIANNTVTDSAGIGFSVRYFSENNNIVGNVVINSTFDGFEIDDSKFNNLMENTATANGENGFNVRGDSFDNTLTGNTATGNGKHGFQVYYGTANTTLIENTATGNLWNGFKISSCNDTTLIENTATGNLLDGFRLSGAVHNSTLKGNTISGNNGYGISMWEGSEDSLAYLNILYNNTESNGYDDGISNSWDNGTHGNYWGNYTGSGTYPISGSSGSVDHYPFGYDWGLITIGSSGDIEYAHATTGHSISWSPEASNPDSYVIYRNGTEVTSGSWNSSSETISISVDGLNIGAYNYTILVNDTDGNAASDTVIVTVIDTTSPSLDSPEDLEYEVGTTGNSITWSPSDLDPSCYAVWRNDTLVNSGSWNSSSETVTISVDGLEVGTYNYTIEVVDGSGNSAQDMVLVIVTSSGTTSTTTTTETTTGTTTTETTTPTDTDTAEPGEIDPLVVALGGGTVLAVLVVLVAVYFKKLR